MDSVTVVCLYDFNTFCVLCSVLLVYMVAVFCAVLQQSCGSVIIANSCNVHF